jgi:large subunit ribosomal protein L21
VYAIIEDSGTQIKVAEGDEFAIDCRDVGDEKVLQFDRVLMVGDAETDEPARIGTPYLEGASVSAEVLGEFKDQKIDVIKYKRRKGYRRKTGHRQGMLRVKITKIKV